MEAGQKEQMGEGKARRSGESAGQAHDFAKGDAEQSGTASTATENARLVWNNSCRMRTWGEKMDLLGANKRQRRKSLFADSADAGRIYI
jgi:hypothetical protein